MAMSLDDLKKRMQVKVPTITPALASPAIIENIALVSTIIETVNASFASQPSRLGFELQEKVAQLQQSLLDRHPRMPVLLREIHTVLRAQPENVTLMSEEEIAVIVDGLKIQTGVEFAASALTPAGKKSTSSKIKQLGLGAF